MDRNVAYSRLFVWIAKVALRKESVDRNSALKTLMPIYTMSLSARRAWIEISDGSGTSFSTSVALRKESVDRNMPRENLVNGVGLVALRKESVDRNLSMGLDGRFKLWSLSARRAWIEIAPRWRVSGRALSLSARRAWIEIPAGCWRDARRAVALRKESVDRNPNSIRRLLMSVGRSPQGERG